MNRRGLLKSAAFGLLLGVPATVHAQTAGQGQWSTPMQLSAGAPVSGAGASAVRWPVGTMWEARGRSGNPTACCPG